MINQVKMNISRQIFMIYIGDFGVSLSSFGALYEFLCILQIF